jgi:hypothetical protein
MSAANIRFRKCRKKLTPKRSGRSVESVFGAHPEPTPGGPASLPNPPAQKPFHTVPIYYINLGTICADRQLPGDCTVRVNADAAKHHSAWRHCAFQWPILKMRVPYFGQYPIKALRDHHPDDEGRARGNARLTATREAALNYARSRNFGFFGAGSASCSNDRSLTRLVSIVWR